MIGAAWIGTAAGQPVANTQTQKLDFAADAWEGNMAEISLAKLAQQKNCDKPTADLAGRLEQDYTKANQQLTGALHGSVKLPDRLIPLYQQTYDRLSRLSCPLFAGEYTKAATEMQRESLRILNNEAASGTNPALKQYAQNSIATVQQNVTASEAAHAAVMKKYGDAAKAVPVGGQSYPNARSAATSMHATAISKVSNAEAAFINEMGGHYLAVIDLSKIAEARAKNPKVKELASKMIAQNEQALEHLKASLPDGFHTPANPSANQVKRTNRLEHLSGAQFDDQYLKYMQIATGEAVGLLNHEVQTGQNQKLKQYASEELPKGQQNLKELHSMPRQMAEAKKQ
jgi:putative membrane protein